MPSLTETKMLDFLRAHQPMPPDHSLDDATAATYNSARVWFEESPSDRCVPLLLNSFGDGDGFGMYQRVVDTLKRHDRAVVVDALRESLGSEHESVRYWSAQVAAEIPDAILGEPLRALLRDPSPGIRAAAVFALGEVGGKDNKAAVRALASTESDPEVVEAIELVGELLG